MTPLHVLVIGNDALAGGLRTLPEGDSLQIETAPSVEDVLASPRRADVVVVDRRSSNNKEGIAQLAKAIKPVPLVVIGDDESLARAIFAAADRAWLRSSLAAALDELEAQRGAVMQISQLKHELVATLAHDIKGPLTSIVGFAELLEEGFLEGDEATDAAKTIRTNAQRLATLANDMLALSRVEYGELELADDRVDVIEILCSAIEAVAAERTIENAFAVEHAYVRGDAERLRQVFDNLLRNAIKYSPGGEPVRVEVREAGNGFTIAIQDRGIGVPPDDLPKLFNRFARASNARKTKIAGHGRRALYRQDDRGTARRYRHRAKRTRRGQHVCGDFAGTRTSAERRPGPRRHRHQGRPARALCGLRIARARFSRARSECRCRCCKRRTSRRRDRR